MKYAIKSDCCMSQTKKKEDEVGTYFICAKCYKRCFRKRFTLDEVYKNYYENNNNNHYRR